jgi:hypothetical protein
MRENLLYVALNDGSDTRIVKEIRSYNKKYDIIFLGIGQKKNSFISDFVSTEMIIRGEYKSPLVLLKFIFKYILIKHRVKPKLIHVVDEQLWILLWLFTFRRYCVRVDIFDSLFLKLNLPKNQFGFLKRLLYNNLNCLYVTDHFRYNLLPDYINSEVRILPNVPERSDLVLNKNKHLDNTVHIFYVGTLTKNRGSEYLLWLVQDERVFISCFGWIKDDITQELIGKDRVVYRGVLTQTQVNTEMARVADYLVAIYPFDNLNNIYASPNKVYDGIHTETPIIINSEVKVSKFVSDLNIGIILSPSDLQNLRSHVDHLICKKEDFTFSSELRVKYSWTNYEHQLLK